jgi:hypothetical protein
MDVAADLKDRFWVVELDLLEKWEAHGLLPDGKTIPDVWNESEHRAMDMLKACRESVDSRRFNAGDKSVSGKQSGDV